MSACITGRFERGAVRVQLYILHYAVMFYLSPATGLDLKFAPIARAGAPHIPVLEAYASNDMERHFREGDAAFMRLSCKRVDGASDQLSSKCTLVAEVYENSNLDVRFLSPWSRFFNDESLLAHMQMKHEVCNLCDSMGWKNEYYLNPKCLSRHYQECHYVCAHPDCATGGYRQIAFADEKGLEDHYVRVHKQTFVQEKGKNKLEMNWFEDVAEQSTAATMRDGNFKRYPRRDIIPLAIKGSEAGGWRAKDPEGGGGVEHDGTGDPDSEQVEVPVQAGTARHVCAFMESFPRDLSVTFEGTAPEEASARRAKKKEPEKVEQALLPAMEALGIECAVASDGPRSGAPSCLSALWGALCAILEEDDQEGCRMRPRSHPGSPAISYAAFEEMFLGTQFANLADRDTVLLPVVQRLNAAEVENLESMRIHLHDCPGDPGAEEHSIDWAPLERLLSLRPLLFRLLRDKTNQTKDLLAPWPARSRWRLSDGSLGRFYGDQLFLAIRAVQESDSTVQVELPLSAFLAELGRDPHTYISEIRFPEQGDDEEGHDAKHYQLLDDVGPALPMLKLPRDGGAYAYIRESQKNRVQAPAEEHQIHVDPSSKPWNPLFRWFLCGSPGSGLGCHQDPNSTMFWNACIVGKKRWCIFPPSTPESVLVSREGLPCWLPGSGTTEHPEYHPSASAKAWFEQEYERVRSLHCNAQRSGAAAGIGMVEFIQCEGEVVVCPAGWWHIVLVLEPSVTFTENWLADRDIGSALGLLKAAPWQAKILWRLQGRSKNEAPEGDASCPRGELRSSPRWTDAKLERQVSVSVIRTRHRDHTLDVLGSTDSTREPTDVVHTDMNTWLRDPETLQDKIFMVGCSLPAMPIRTTSTRCVFIDGLVDFPVRGLVRESLQLSADSHTGCRLGPDLTSWLLGLRRSFDESRLQEGLHYNHIGPTPLWRNARFVATAETRGCRRPAHSLHSLSHLDRHLGPLRECSTVPLDPGRRLDRSRRQSSGPQLRNLSLYTDCDGRTEAKYPHPCQREYAAVACNRTIGEDETDCLQFHLGMFNRRARVNAEEDEAKAWREWKVAAQAVILAMEPKAQQRVLRYVALCVQRRTALDNRDAGVPDWEDEENLQQDFPSLGEAPVPNSGAEVSSLARHARGSHPSLRSFSSSAPCYVCVCGSVAGTMYLY
ncbi:jmjd6 [Symbiodinium sp. CCMP2592]|nr:jmjd6 [Symbiodinium sp. CCMP2592]